MKAKRIRTLYREKEEKNLKGSKNSLELHEPSMKYIVATSMYILSVSYVHALTHSLRATSISYVTCHAHTLGRHLCIVSSFSTRTKKRTLLLIRCSVFRFNTRCCRWDYCRDFFSSLLVCFSTVYCGPYSFSVVAARVL